MHFQKNDTQRRGVFYCMWRKVELTNAGLVLLQIKSKYTDMLSTLKFCFFFTSNDKVGEKLTGLFGPWCRKWCMWRDTQTCE